MSATLTQSTSAAFPDRPATNGAGLAVGLSVGAGGEALTVSVPAGGSALHTRLMIAPNTLAGGRAVVLAGRAAGVGVFAVRLDGDARRVTVDVGATMLAADLPLHLAWHAVELRTDPSVGTVTLWLNGVPAGAATGLVGLVRPDQLLIGAIHKDSTAQGAVHLDEWVVAEQYIGPVVVGPTGDHLDDPRRWAAIYNTASEDSVQWADDYRASRGLPYANLIGLPLDPGETISEAAFVAMRDGVDQYLRDNGLHDQVGGLIVGHGVPGRYTRSDSQVGSVVAQLQLIDGGEASTGNPVATVDDPARPTAADLGNVRATARIDAPALGDATAFVDRAVAIEQNGLGDGDDATLWFDPVTVGPIYDAAVADLIDWAGSVDRQRLRLPMVQTQPTDPATDTAFASINRDGVFWGWRQATPPAGFFAEPAGRRVFAAQLYDGAATAPTLRDAGSGHWAMAALQAGYAATCGSARAISTTALPLVRPFMQALRRGWTLGEAWAVATPAIRAGIELIGDPLMTVPLPRAGWNLYGPADALAQIAFDQPIACLRDGERQLVLPVEAQPVEGGAAVFALRRVDAQGREETGASSIALTTFGGGLRELPPLPTWPAIAGWAPRVDAGDYRFVADWPTAFGDQRIARVDLLEQAVGVEPAVVDSIDVQSTATFVRFTRPAEPASKRFRFRVVADTGVVVEGPWSRWLALPAVSPVALVDASAVGGGA